MLVQVSEGSSYRDSTVVPFYPWKICMFKLLQSFQCWVVSVKKTSHNSPYSKIYLHCITGRKIFKTCIHTMLRT